jgi:Arylsulfotransferase (ASST)
MGWSVVRPTGLTHHIRARSFKGYTLVLPTGGDSAYLVDMQGRFVHRWRMSGYRAHLAKLLPNGNLMAMATPTSVERPEWEVGDAPLPFEQRIRLFGANETTLLELDWDGNIVWRYENEFIHHDFHPLEDGNVIVPVFVEIPDDLAKRVRGGVRRPREKPQSMISDDFIEIDGDGREVDRISLWKLLDPVKDPIGKLENRVEWTHTNSVDLASNGDLLFSCRWNSRVGTINRDSHELTWKYGAPNTFHQHNATSLPNGNVLIFDNGMNRLAEMSYSRLVEVNPKTDEVEWEYYGKPRSQFFSGHISGAQRLPNANTLVCEGTSGRVFETTREGEVVWEWINPMLTTTPRGDVSWLFRAHRYAPGYAGLADRDLDPERYADLNRLHALG